MNLSKQFTSREKVLLVVMGIVLLLGAYIWFVQQPVMAQTEQLTAEQSELDSEVLLLETKAKLISDMKAELKDIDGAAAETPKYDNLQHVIAMLNAIMGDTSDYTLNFQPVVQPEEGNIIRRVIDMSFTCNTYAQARTVVKSLHDGAFRCQISELTVGAKKAENAPEGTVATLQNSPAEVTLTITYFENIS